MRKVVLVSLLNGQDIVGEEVDSTPDLVVLKKAFVVIAGPSQDPAQPRGVSLNLVPWPPMTDHAAVKDVAINRHMVVTVTQPIKQIIDGYNQTTSGILLPTTPRLLTE